MSEERKELKVEGSPFIKAIGTGRTSGNYTTGWYSELVVTEDNCFGGMAILDPRKRYFICVTEILEDPTNEIP